MSLKEKISYIFLVFVITSSLVVYLTPLGVLSVKGNSMEPKIREGDAIVIIPVNTSDIRVGDIITYRREQVTIAHQVIGFENGKTQTKGINLSKEDPYLVDPYEVVGKHITTISFGGNITAFVHSFAGFLKLVLAPVILIVYNEGRKLEKV